MKQSLLVLSAANKVPLLHIIKQSVPNIKLIAGDISSNVISRFFVDDFWEMPLLKDLEIDYFIANCKNQNVKYIIPTREGELLHFARWKESLKKEDIHVMVTNAKGIAVTSDKLLFYQSLKKYGYPVIKTSLNIADIESDSYVVKERAGAGSKNLYINISKEEAIRISPQLNAPIFQPYIGGKEYSIDVYMMKNGKAKGAIVRERVLVINGESQITRTVIKTDLAKLVMEVAETLNLYGHVMFQIVEDIKGQPHIIECNARFGGASTLSIKAGLDSFNWFIRESNKQSICDMKFKSPVEQLTQIRYSKDLII
ncbi:ATP-grasp domain-containing protein [Lysinibacillus sp. FSL M8-0134]|uniref:ATP-grasp domain-containing protein n=1 Tax=Lysinibacillus sp. FSL M8-0134 TaxID=2921717 RepID=UPI0031195DA0